MRRIKENQEAQMKKYRALWKIGTLACLICLLAGYVKSGGEPSSLLQKHSFCALCGDGKNSLKSRYGNREGLGLLCLNDWTVTELCPSSGEYSENDGITYTWGEDNSYSIQTEQISDRGITLMQYTSRGSRVPDMEYLSDILCAGCLKKARKAVHIYGNHPGRKVKDVCLVEFPGIQLYGIQQSFQYYLLDGYYAQAACQGRQIQLTIFQTPEPSGRIAAPLE